MICPLCGKNRARRGCPALGHQICAVCCGTKRLVEIRCPDDCTWLASAREHPPAVAVRQQQRDVGVLVDVMRDFNQRQSQLFFLITQFIVGYRPAELQPLADEDVADAADALAATYETAARGVIYEHRPASAAAERFTAALKPMLTEAGKGGGSPFERDAAATLRRLAGSVRDVQKQTRGNRRAFVDLIGRVVRTPPAEASQSPPDADRPSIVIP